MDKLSITPVDRRAAAWPEAYRPVMERKSDKGATRRLTPKIILIRNVATEPLLDHPACRSTCESRQALIGRLYDVTRVKFSIGADPGAAGGPSQRPVVRHGGE
jgi:hypothetical protein